MNIAVIGTGYVGLVTGVCLAEIGHRVTCIDTDEAKIVMLKNGIVPIYEPGLEQLMLKNIKGGRLSFTSSHQEGLRYCDVVFIAVGTPQNEDGSANLAYIEQAARDIGLHAAKDAIVVVKSTVPVGTTHAVKRIITSAVNGKHTIDVVSNPEFLREGSAVTDTFYGDRIVIGADRAEAAAVIEQMYEPLGIPVIKTDVRSAEMIKYASNAFLATKISFINEVANLCEKMGADVQDVARGMGMDDRIGSQFLEAGIGYGGSCFPKDTRAFVKMAENVQYDFRLLKSVIQVNERQQTMLVNKAMLRFGGLKGKRAALLGLTFKPNTDDMRESAAIRVAERLIEEGAQVVAYDPVGMDNAMKVLHPDVRYAETLEGALFKTDFAFLLTGWDEITESLLQKIRQCMKEPVLFDGRNCFSLDEARRYHIEYHSIGRPSVLREEAFVRSS